MERSGSSLAVPCRASWSLGAAAGGPGEALEEPSLPLHCVGGVWVPCSIPPVSWEAQRCVLWAASLGFTKISCGNG